LYKVRNESPYPKNSAPNWGQVSSGNELTAEQVSRCAKVGPLQFVLGFEGDGFRLKLTVKSPDGQIL